jgi:hypothetical protein
VNAPQGWKVVALVAAFAVVASGCGAHVYEPGVYKGRKDPLLSVQATPEHKALLKERLTMGQTDR